MGKQKVMIATPCRRLEHRMMVESRTKVVLTTQRAKVERATIYGESMICRGRQTLLAQFLASKNDWLYWWDDDIETRNTGGADGNLLDMLLVHGKPFVGGLYSTRGMGGHVAARMLDPLPEPKRLWPVRWLAGGSMLVRRDAAEAICEVSVEYERLSNCGAGTGRNWAAFSPFVLGGEYISEDYAFCERWRQTGGECFADLDVRLVHWGEAPFGLIDPREEARNA